MNLAKSTLKIVPQKIWNQCHIHIECNQWIFTENQLSGFYFKIILTGNELSITNHELHGFPNSFQHIKNNKKKPCELIGQIHFCLQLEKEVLKKRFWQNHKGNYRASFITQKSTHWWIILFFFQNPYCWFILEHFYTSLTKPTTLSRYIDNFLF